MQAFVMEYYVEPENIPTEIVQDEDEDIFWFALLTMSVSYYTTKLFAPIIIRAVLKLTHPALPEF